VSISAIALGVAVAVLFGPGSANAEDAVSGQVIVGFSAASTAQRMHAIVDAAGGLIKRRLGGIHAAACQGRTASGGRLNLERVLGDIR
jgi:hypothetical protein